MTKLADKFQAMIDVVGGGSPDSNLVEHAAAQAASAYSLALRETIMPRRVTLRAANGARLSVIGKNRRIVKLVEVHPESLWEGDTAPVDTDCGAGDDSFSRPFASAFLGAVGADSIRIETGFLSEKAGLPKTGYPAMMLPREIDAVRDAASGGPAIEAMFDAFPALPRARFGKSPDCIVPDGSHVSVEWMLARAAELENRFANTRSEASFIRTDGAIPQGMAVAWIDGEGCLVLSGTPDDFGDLTERLVALRPYL